MFPIVFERERVNHILHSIEHGRPITPSAEGWNVADMLMAAGTLHYALMAHAPALNGKAFGMADLPAEQQEAFAETYLGELARALETCSQLTRELHAGAGVPAEKVVGRVITVDNQPLVALGSPAKKAA